MLTLLGIAKKVRLLWFAVDEEFTMTWNRQKIARATLVAMALFMSHATLAAPLSTEEKKEHEEFLQSAGQYKSASEDYRATVNSILKRAYERRRGKLLNEYDTQIRVEEEEERTRRIAAITLFEDFLRRYPNDKRWTPDVIFRLAELYFEKSNDQFLVSTELYEKELRDFEKGILKTSPLPPKQDYTPTIELHRRLIREFPKYRLIDGAYYLLGYCLAEMGEVEQGNAAFLALVCANKHKPPLSAEDVAPAVVEQPEVTPSKRGKKTSTLVSMQEQRRKRFDESVYKECEPLIAKSRFNPESWIRVGEFHFDENQLGPAIAAYRKVLGLGVEENPYYDEALYKLAWTYYRADKFDDAIQYFDQLVVYADKEYSRTGKAGSEMRPESIQYLAISFAEEDWDGDTEPDPVSAMERANKFYKDRTAEGHVYEVYRRLADILFDTTKYEESIAVYKYSMQQWPHRPENPEIQDRVIVALERLRRFDDAIKEREEFTRLFGKDTEWEKQNINNPKALKKARELDEQALIQAAVFHHKAGQELKKQGLASNDPAIFERASSEYALAAEAYKHYLERFPNTKNSYEIRYSYASCLYYSQRFLEAAAVFAEVRESNLDNRYLEEAAFSATKAYEEYINMMVAQNQLSNPPLPDAKTTPESLDPQPIPEPFQKWKESLDAYAKRLPKSPKTPRLSYKAAEIAYRFFDFKDARERFGTIYDTYCSDPIAINAGQAVLVTHQLEKNLDRMEEWATKLKSGKCGGGAGADVASGAGELLVGIKFQRAQQLFKDKKWDEAAVAYIGLVDSNPSSTDADKALNNAAVAYENSKRFESATKIYERLWQSYGDSPLAHEALWRAAINYRRFFAFDRAVQNFLILADSQKFSTSEHRNEAIYNAAVILENDQAYDRSAQLFLRYAAAVKATKAKEAAEAHFRAALIYEKMNDLNRMKQTLASFVKEYGSTPDQDRYIVEAHFLTAKMARKRKDFATVEKEYRATVAEFQRRKLPEASDAAEFAANAAFDLVEKKLEAFLKKEIKGDLKVVLAQQKKLGQEAVALKKEYEQIWTYKRARWTLAAMYRSGTIYEHFARAMAEGFRKIPMPAKLKKLGQEAIDIYQEQLDAQLEKIVRPLEDEAKKLYEACIERAKQFAVSNQYTEEALKRLNAFDPTSYPLLKHAKVEVVFE